MDWQENIEPLGAADTWEFAPISTDVTGCLQTRLGGGYCPLGQVWRRGTVSRCFRKYLKLCLNPSPYLSYKTDVLNCCGKVTERKPSTAKKGAGICAGSRTLAKGQSRNPEAIPQTPRNTVLA